MAFETWALFAAAIFIASVSPGPNVLIVVVNALKYGAKGAVFTILGNILCLFCVALLAAVGVGTLVATAPLAFLAMKIAGGAYLLWLGVKMIRASFAATSKIDVSDVAAELQNTPAGKLVTEAFMVSASNPKAILFLTAIFPQFLNSEAAIAPQFAMMFATIIALVCLIHGAYGFMAYSLRDRPISERVRRWMARITGTTFIGLGVGVAFSK